MKKILFVCLGNICRSACAETVFRKKAEKAGLTGVEVDSAGISSYHKGEKADPRMIRFAAERGYDITSVSRPIVREDFKKFDMLIGMDDSNIEELNDLAETPEERGKIHKITDFCKVFDYDEIPDPYYGGNEGFGTVIDILEDACDGLIETVKKA